jgi:hypothetical protein
MVSGSWHGVSGLLWLVSQLWAFCIPFSQLLQQLHHTWVAVAGESVVGPGGHFAFHSLKQWQQQQQQQHCHPDRQ